MKEDIRENKFWLLFWCIASFTVISIIGLSQKYESNKMESLIEAGYTLEEVPTQFKTVWVKK